MKPIQALSALGSVTSGQWGMVTTAQAEQLGVTRLVLSRLTQSGLFERVAHGVYRDIAVPAAAADDLRAAWLSIEPRRFAEDRIADRANGAVVASSSAAMLHGIGDLWPTRHEFVTPFRRQTQREGLRFRHRELPARDVTLVEGLPVMRIERTLADLLEEIGDRSLVSGALKDALRQYSVDLEYLQQLFDPLAGRNGFQKGDGASLLGDLLREAGLDAKAVAQKLPSVADKTTSALSHLVGRRVHNDSGAEWEEFHGGRK